jgi:hypothetical protein
MMQNEHDTPDEPRSAGGPESPAHVAKDEGASDSHERDHELFAHQSEPHESEIPAPEAAPETAAEPAPEPAIAPPVRKSGGYWQKFTLLLAVLGLLAIGGGLAAIKFKDKDERLRAISDAIDAAAKDPKAFASSVETKLAELWASASSKVEGDRKSKLGRTAANEPSAPTPKPAAEPNPLPAVETPRPTPTPGWAAPREPKPAPAARDEQPASIAPPTPAPSVRAEDSAQIAALVKRIEQLEATSREALEAARDAQRSAKPAETGEKTATPTADEGTYLNALEGRIDELADEIRKVREQLDQPKSETRVAPDAAESAASTQVKAITAAETLGLAQSLMHSLERGRPFAAEQAALAERGVDPQLLAALAPVAEQGAPTAARLLASFAPVAKRLRAFEDAPAAGGSLTDQLLHDAGKLVHVRPAGERANASITELVARIESTLAHDDLDGASEAFAKLPDNARSEAKAFGEALNQRREAEQAATSLVANALAGLAHLKN